MTVLSAEVYVSYVGGRQCLYGKRAAWHPT